jgi:long-chain fatty acid transport protein
MEVGIRSALFIFVCLIIPVQAIASGYGVFTQGASGLGQANAVVAHTTGPSSAYFNPALLNDVPGTQVEFGTTAVYSDREIDFDGGGKENGDSAWNFPSTFYLSHQINDKFTTGLAVFFPFGLSNEWDDDYEGRYIGTEGELFSVNINPSISWRVNDRLSLAGGVSAVYLDSTLKSKINQTAAYQLLQLQGAPLPPLPPGVELNDIEQKFEGDEWGFGFNLGMHAKVTDKISFGAAYRSEIDIDVEGADVKFSGVNPFLTSAFPNTKGDADITLPQQFVAGVAAQLTDDLIVEVGLRWEDWNSTDELKVELATPVFNQPNQIVPRDWHSTWTYNIGGQYQLNETVALNAGYLYGQNAVPGSTLEPVIPDSDAHLFCVGTDLNFGQWTISGAFSYEYHDTRSKNNNIGDPLGSALASAIAGTPVTVGTANGDYDTDIYLFALSLGYAF